MSLVVGAACAGGTEPGADDDGPDAAVSIDAALTDTAATDAPVDLDATTGVDATTDAATDASPDAATDASPDAMPLTGDTCQMADLITITGGLGNATVAGTTASYANNYMPPLTCTSGYLQDGPDHVYQIAVPAGARLTAAVTPGAGYDAGIYLVAAPAAMCDASPIACLDGDDSGGSAALDDVRYDNTTSGPVDVFIVIDGTSTIGGAYSLAVTVATAPPPTGGDACGNADPITVTGGAGTATGTTTTAAGFYNDYVPPEACSDGGGNDHVHSVTVPAGERLVASVTPMTGTFDATLYMIAGPASACEGAFACLAGDDASGAGGTETIEYTNMGAGAVEVFIVVDGYDELDEGDYTLSVAIGAPVGDTCQTAETITLTAGMATVTGTTSAAAGYTNRYEPPEACTSNYLQDGLDRVHVVAVPTGTTLTATVTPTGFDAGIYLVAGPAAACDATPIVCLAGRDAGSSGTAETVTYANTSGATVDVMIVVDSYSPTSYGSYALAVQVQ